MKVDPEKVKTFKTAASLNKWLASNHADEQEIWVKLFKKNSGWSKRNREHAERLIKDKKMQPAGLLEVKAAKLDGRWDAAYAGSAEFEIPDDFLKALTKNKQAKQTFDTCNRRNLYTIYHRLHTAKKPETRQRRMDKILETLARGEKFH